MGDLVTTRFLSLMLLKAPPGEVAPPRWDEVWGPPAPRHAGAALKPAPGRQAGSPAIRSLHVHDDRHVLVGHGDWDVNDGSTGLVTFDPVTRTSEVHGTYPTEAFTAFRTIGETTYALFTDPTGFWEPTLPYAMYPVSDTSPGMIDAIHVFDIVEHDGLLWVGGSTHGPQGSGQAAAWWSDDQGASWTKTIPTGIVGDYERIYRLGVVGGRLYALLNWSLWAADNGKFYVWDSASQSWSPSPYPGPDPVSPTPAPPYPVPRGAVTARTSTHWILGTRTGDLYTLPIT